MDTKSVARTRALKSQTPVADGGQSSKADAKPARTGATQQSSTVDIASLAPRAPMNLDKLLRASGPNRVALATNGRLSHSVLPAAYHVKLNASLDRDDFSGSVSIGIANLEVTDRIELNARDLDLTNVRVTVGGSVIAGKVVMHPKTETAELIFDKPLPKGGLQLDIDFAGRLNPSLLGLYRAEDAGERALVTQCEAADARAIFPCFDEPDFKATYTWTVTTDPGKTVITNGAALDVVKNADGTETHTFSPTQKIASYAVAATIGAYEATPARVIDGIPCRVYALPGKAKFAELALDVTQQVLPYFANYFKQKYPFGKLDHVAVPGFDAGGMENIAAIFYRQQEILADLGATPWLVVKRIAEVVAHEIGHMWFGNLVTMKWWDDLWLNEAFATLVSFKAVDAWRPELRMWDGFVDDKDAALRADALTNTHPIWQPIETPGQATENFDVITYQKGSAVLRMLETYLGAEVFQAGVSSYLDEFKFSNATGDDLWRHLSDASGQDVNALMRSWIKQKGFPLVSLTREGDEVRVNQRRFFNDPKAMEEGSPQTWNVPLVIRCGGPNGVTTERYLLKSSDDVIQLPVGTTWFYPNVDSTGFYRCQMSGADKAAVLGELSSLTPNERSSLLSDEWALVKNGRQHVGAFLDTLQAFRGDEDYAVNGELSGFLGSISFDLLAEADKPLFQKFVGEFFANAKGIDPNVPATSDPDAVRRSNILYAKGVYGRDPVVVEQARKFIAQEMANPDAVDSNLASTMLSVAAVNGDAALLQKYVDVFVARRKAGAAPALQTRYLSVLSAFEDPAARAKVLALCLDGTIPQENIGSVLSSMLTKADAWELLKANWDTLAPRVGGLSVARLVQATGSLPVDLASDVAAFFASHPIPAAEAALKKAQESMMLRAELVAREGPQLAEWLKNHSVA